MTVEKIKNKEKTIVLVGTAHISKESIELVNKTIEKEKPEIVGVELDAQRYAQLKMGRRWQEMNIGQVIKEGKVYLFLINLLLSNLQRRLGDELGIAPGTEMLEAMRLAEEKKIPIALLDRDIQITMKRAFQNTGIVEKAKLLMQVVTGFFQEGEALTKEKVEELKKTDILNKLMSELSKEFPSLKKTLVDERDLFIANQILNAPGKKIVAVLGLGHLEGVKKFLDKKRDIRELTIVKKKRSIFSILKYVIPALFVVFIAYAFFAKGIEATANVFLWWFLITGICSAIGALIARSHALSILTAFVAAPFTTLHPALASGWFAAGVEMKFRNPKVKDFESLSKLNSYSDWEKNRVTHLLMVAAYTNIGSTIGVIIAFPYLLALLGI
ncbi:MAG: TraB/GumN family protein [Candidatus ainarchaeum sp.]|nr:TraB/GumN family protein [Candidatus ainarchaeum sp.]